jgi:hypothetical protein
MLFIFIPAFAIIASKKDFSVLPPPKPRDFEPYLAEWAGQKGFIYAPQLTSAVSGTYRNRWFVIHTRNAENALEIYMRVKNSHRYGLQIFGDWLEESGVTAFINRFRIYSNPPGLGESLFEAGTNLQKALSGFPNLRARLELAFDPVYKDELRYSLLTDLPTSDTLEAIMDSLIRFCDVYEQVTIQ